MPKSNKKTRAGFVREETEVITTIDEKTGKIDTRESTKTTTYSKDVEPDFVKLYVADIVRLKDLPPATEKLLLLIVRNMNYNNTFMNHKFLKEMMIKELGIKMDTLNKGITNLRKKGILIPVKGARGLYFVDPELFARGKWEDIRNLRLVIEYNSDGTKSLKSNAREQLKQLSLFD